MGTTGRIDGLNVWRALLMLGGMATHATIMREDVAGLALIANLSHAFRMGAFFVISGLLTGFALLRRPRPELWLRDRLIQIGIPTVFGIGVVSPLIGICIRQFPASAGLPEPILFDWYHLWFLVALLLYSVAGYAMQRRERMTRLLARFDNAIATAPHAQVRIMLAIAGLTLCGILTGILVVSAVVPDRYAASLLQIRLIIGYAPVFLLGFAIGRSDRLRAAFIGSPLAPSIILLVFLAAYILWYLGFAGSAVGLRHAWFADLLTVLGASFCPPAAAALILRSAISISHVPAYVTRLADASFTMYILHYPIAIEMTALLAYAEWNPWVEAAITLAASALLSYAIHRLVVRRSPLAALLLNGRLKRVLAVAAPDDRATPGAAA